MKLWSWLGAVAILACLGLAYRDRAAVFAMIDHQRLPHVGPGRDISPNPRGRPRQTQFWRSGQYKVVIDGDWKLQSSEAQNKVWLYNLAADPTERHEVSRAEPARTRAMLQMIAAQDRQGVKPKWPSLLQGPILVDRPSGAPQKKGEDDSLRDD